MAEEFVRKEHFEEFSVRIAERFLGVEKQMEQGFAHAEKAREQNFVHLNQRFDDMTQSVNQRFDDLKESVNHRFNSLEKMMAWQNRVSMGIFLLILAAVLKYLFFPG